MVKYNILSRIITIVLIHSLLFCGISFAMADATDGYTLAPPLATDRLAEIVQNTDGTYSVVSTDKAGGRVDAAFRDDWALEYVDRLIAQMLVLAIEKNLRNPAGLLVPLIESHISEASGEAGEALKKFDIGAIKDVRSGNNIIGFSLPVADNGSSAHRLIYNLERGDRVIQMKDGRKVYVRVESLKYTGAKALKRSAGVSDRPIAAESRDEVTARLARLQEIKEKEAGDITENDRQDLIASARHFNLYPEYLEKEMDKKKILEYAFGLAILASAELTALDYPDVPVFNLSAVDAINDGNFSHELNHLFTDIQVLDALLSGYISINDKEQSPQSSAVRQEMNKIRTFIGKNQIECKGWQRVISGWKGLRQLNPKIISALIDALEGYVKKVLSERADIEKYARDHLSMINNVAVNDSSIGKYVSSIGATNRAFPDNIKKLEDIKNMMQTDADTLVDINQSIQDALKPYENNDRVKVQLQLAPDKLQVKGSPVEISFIWANLVGNSIDAILEAMDKGKTGKGTLTIGTRIITVGGEEFIDIRISDNGMGIPKELLEGRRIFKEGVTGKEHGTGKGLFLVERTIKDLSGEIDVQSEAGIGTTFDIRLPLIAGDETPVEFVIRHTNIFREALDHELTECERAVLELKAKPDLTDDERRKLLDKISLKEETLTNSFKSCDVELAKKIEDSEIGSDKNKILRGIQGSFEDIIVNALSVVSSAAGMIKRRPEKMPEFLTIIESRLERVRMTLDFSQEPTDVRLWLHNNGVVELYIPSVHGEMEPFQSIIASFSPSQDSIAVTERIHAINFQDAVKYTQTQSESRPIIVALGTGWIKGYEKGQDQFTALNPLISSIRTYCESKGIVFIVDNDDNLLARISGERKIEGKNNAKVIVLAGKDTVEADNFKALRDDVDNAFVVGVNNENLTDNSYIRLMEMLTLALKLSLGMEINPDSTPITISQDKERHIYIFIPRAEPMDYERLKATYEVQRSA